MLVGSLALVATALLAGTVQGQTSSDIMKATLAQPNEKTAEVSTEELRRILADGSATVFDARPHLEFAISHIPGALNVAPKAGVPMSLYVSDTAEIGRSSVTKGGSHHPLLQAVRSAERASASQRNSPQQAIPMCAGISLVHRSGARLWA